MDDLLDAIDLLADRGLADAFVWLLRLVGVVAILVGVWLWLGTEVGPLVPAIAVVVGLALLVAPSLLLALAELA